MGVKAFEFDSSALALDFKGEPIFETHCIFVWLFLGITSPMVKVEMVLSAETWHTPPHGFYTLEYLHQGESKIWYSVPRGSKEKFLEIIKTEMNEETCDIKNFMVRNFTVRLRLRFQVHFSF